MSALAGSKGGGSGPGTATADATMIRNATVYSGTEPGRVADVLLTDGKIEAVGAAIDCEGVTQIDGAGLMLTPGFIDMHAHSGLRTFEDTSQRAKLAQGFTTELIGPDGLSPAPVAPERIEERRSYMRSLEGDGPERWPWSTFGEYLEALEETRPATSLVPSIGHNSVRDFVLGPENVRPTSAQLDRMRFEVREALDAGARTLSFGLIYLPGTFAETDELVALAEEAARFAAPLVPHVRTEARGVLEAVGEMIEVSRRSGAPLHLSHLKVVGPEPPVERLLELIDAAALEIPITFDQYPYGAGSTGLATILPTWAQAGGVGATVDRLGEESDRRRIRAEIEDAPKGWDNSFVSCGPERIRIANAPDSLEGLVGRTLGEIATARDADPLDTAFELLAESELAITMVNEYASEESVRKIAAHHRHMLGSDGIFGRRPHPRLHAAAARFLGRYALREGVVRVEEAVARLTARPAALLGLEDRGRIEPGARADVVLLDPERFIDTASFEEPQVEPPGVIGVWVAGRRLVNDTSREQAR
jgi:N-acyl-D-amino-acid deacylase